MSRRIAVVLFAVLAGAVPASAQRQWIVYPTYYEGNQWQTVSSGDLDGRAYKWFYQFDGVMRAYWDLTPQNCIPVGPNTDLFPVKPGMYAIEQWAPSVMPSGVASWAWAPIEVTFDGPGSGEEATKNLFIPWNGAYGTNHQWIGSELKTLKGVWKAAGPGPQAPNGTSCTAGPSGSQVWAKRGSTLYMKWNFAWDITAPVTALRLTEIYSDRPACATPTAGGPIDLRCVGNADPLYDTREPFANDDNRPQQTTTIDGENALAVTNYTVWVCLDPGYPYNVPLTPGLPAGGLFTAQLADRNIDFQLRYNGFNSIKWRTGDTGEFAPDRVFTLNQAPGAQFVPGNYGTLSLLTACSGGRGHRLNIQKNYSDGSTDSSTVNLYDWYNQDGDANAIPVGVNGLRRSEGTNGFRSLSKYGDSFEHGNGGTGSGAFLFVHTVPVNPCKTLSGISFSTLFPTASPMVVESRATSQGTGSFSSTGTWNPDNAKSTTGGTTPGIGSLYAGTGDNGAAATFNWTPSVTAYYNVFATWASNIDASTQAAFTVTSNGSPVTVFKNQREGGNGWQHLAQVELLAGNTYSVTLNAGLSSGGPRVYADAVRWEATGINANLLAATLGSGTCCHTPWADADGDGDVDSDDFALFQACMTITGQPITAGCDCLNPNSDATIDMTDLAAFIACSAGPEVDYIHSTVPPYWPNWPAGCPGKPAQ